LESFKKTGETGQVQTLRLWPGVIIVALQWLIRYLLPAIAPKAMVIGVFGGILGGLAIIVWWLFFSRAARIERWGAIFLIIAVLYGTFFLLDESIATANMGLMFIMYSIPVMCLAFVAWAVLSRNLNSVSRRVTMIITILLASGMWIFLRTDGMTGEGHHDLDWRWAKTNEDRLLAEAENDTSSLLSTSGTTNIMAEWPGFRGPNRNSIVHGTKIATNWSVTPPDEMWRRPVGPGCSSFAVNGNLLYTQEQRGEYETVSCYNLSNGNPVWKHQDKARFYDSHAGPGPRSTPTLVGDHVYTLGATGILNVLDASNGSIIWSRNASSDAGVKAPNWGFASSPLVVSDVVIVALAGKLAAFDISTGNPRWFGEDGGSGYSSPQLLTINGVPQVLLMSKAGAISVDPASGKKLWDYSWPLEDRVLQPSLIEKDELLVTEEYRNIRRIAVTQEGDEWKIMDLWTSSNLKMVFNDVVIHKGYAYGFDGPFIACIDLNDGKRMWRGNRYQGFTLLLADQDIILVLTEKGELALVSASPDKFTEFSCFRALDGKTWSHPVLAGNIIVVRNAQEMAAFKLQ
jgi:outer membrane protein assembly factor BamB